MVMNSACQGVEEIHNLMAWESCSRWTSPIDMFVSKLGFRHAEAAIEGSPFHYLNSIHLPDIKPLRQDSMA